MTHSRARSGDRSYNFFSSQNRAVSHTHYIEATDLGHDRLLTKFPFEYITIDDLHYYRRKADPTTYKDQRLSQLKLGGVSKSEPCLSDVTEYREEFHGWPSINRPPLQRRATHLRAQGGSMDVLTEQKQNFVPYSSEDLHKCRRHLIRKPESLKLTGDIELFPEYRSAFCAINMNNNSNQFKKVIRPTIPSPKRIPRASDPAKNRIEQCHLALDGDHNLQPEYKSKYVTLPLERSRLMPQGSHLSMQGRFGGVPEYQESFRDFHKYGKNLPIKRSDNLKPGGGIQDVAEYTERFKQPDWSTLQKRPSYKMSDNLRPGGEFTKDLPEYYESFRDYHMPKPAKGKCRDTYFKLNGDTDWHPEYRDNFTDFPRSRPIVKKPGTHIRLSGEVVTPPHRFKGYQLAKVDNRDPIEKYLNEPEVRKAQMEMMIRPRPPTRGAENGSGDASNAQRFIYEDTVSQQPEKKPDDEIEKIVQPPSELTPDKPQTHSRFPFKFVVENYDQKPGEKKESLPKFGRRRPSGPTEDYSTVRTRTNVIEGNPDYVRYTMDYNRQQQKNGNGTNDSYQQAVEKRSREMMRQTSTQRADYRSSSTSEERARAGPNATFQKESFTTSSDPRESSEEPFQVLEKTGPAYDSTSTNDESFKVLDNANSRHFTNGDSYESSSDPAIIPVRETSRYHRHHTRSSSQRTPPRQNGHHTGSWMHKEAHYDSNANTRAMGYDQKVLDRNQNNAFNLVGDKPMKPTGWMKPEWYDLKY